MNTRFNRFALLCITVLLLPTISVGQQETADTISQTILALDSVLFDKGFNECDKEAQQRILHADFEFYHDQGGFDKGKAEFISSFMKNMCDPAKKPIRKLVPEFNEFFPLYEKGSLYGVIQRGVHEFYIREPSKPLYKTSTAKFTHLWIQTAEGWKIKRVLSFDHKGTASELEDIKLTENDLLQFTGTYSAVKTGKVEISIQNQQLYIKAGSFQTNLLALSDSSFAHPQAPLTFEFIKNNHGKISKFIVKENGQNVEEAIRN